MESGLDNATAQMLLEEHHPTRVYHSNSGIEWWTWFEGSRFITLIYRDNEWFLRDESRGM